MAEDEASGEREADAYAHYLAEKKLRDEASGPSSVRCPSCGSWQAPARLCWMCPSELSPPASSPDKTPPNLESGSPGKRRVTSIVSRFLALVCMVVFITSPVLIAVVVGVAMIWVAIMWIFTDDL